MTQIIEVKNPASALIAPSAVDTGAYIASLRDEAGYALGRVDWVCAKFFGISMIEQFVKPFSGDWVALQRASEGWTNMGKALELTVENVGSGQIQLASAWTGEASAGASAQTKSIAELTASQAQGCHTIAKQLAGIIELSKTTGQMVASLLSLINDVLTSLAQKAMVPVVGWISGGIDVAKYAHRFWKWVDRLTFLVQDLIDYINRVMQAIALIQRVFGIASKVMSFAAQTVSVAGATYYMDDTSRVQFGAR